MAKRILYLCFQHSSRPLASAAHQRALNFSSGSPMAWFESYGSCSLPMAVLDRRGPGSGRKPPNHPTRYV